MKSFFVILSLSICAVVLSFCVGAFYSFNYPMKYSQVIKEFSADYKVESALIASVVNVESSFREGVVSSKGAVGLMQLLPSTAEWLSGQMGEAFEEEKLKEAKYNLKLDNDVICNLCPIPFFFSLESILAIQIIPKKLKYTISIIP